MLTSSRRKASKSIHRTRCTSTWPGVSLVYIRIASRTTLKIMKLMVRKANKRVHLTCLWSRRWSKAAKKQKSFSSMICLRLWERRICLCTTIQGMLSNIIKISTVSVPFSIAGSLTLPRSLARWLTMTRANGTWRKCVRRVRSITGYWTWSLRTIHCSLTSTTIFKECLIGTHGSPSTRPGNSSLIPLLCKALASKTLYLISPSSQLTSIKARLSWSMIMSSTDSSSLSGSFY